MTVIRQYDKETCARMEFLAYLILIFALLAVSAGMYIFYHWLVS